jgi:hypothetical protein
VTRVLLWVVARLSRSSTCYKAYTGTPDLQIFDVVLRKKDAQCEDHVWEQYRRDGDDRVSQ